MTHDAEGTAARYLGGQMSGRRRARFSQHLLDCDACWQEVATAQEGRRLLESTRTVAPAHLRDRVRALAQAEGGPAAPYRRRRLSLRQLRPVLVPSLVLSLVVVLLAVGGAWTTTSLLDRGPDDPTAVTAAVADFESRELPGRQLPAVAAPDLSALRLTPVGAGGGVYDGLEVDGYAYRDAAGRRLVLYLSDEAFPTAVGAEPLDGPDGPWMVRRGDVVVLCARSPHALLVVGEDDELVRLTAVELGVV